MWKTLRVIFPFLSLLVILISCVATSTPTVTVLNGTNYTNADRIDLAESNQSSDKYVLPKAYTIYVDNKFSSTELASIRQAGLDWFNATRGQIQFTFFYFENIEDRVIRTTIFENTMIKIPSSDDFVFKTDILQKENVIGFYYNTDEAYYIGVVYDRIRSPIQFKATVVHELGHSLGLEHDNSGMAMMNSALGEQHTCLTQIDMIQFCNKYSCNIKDMYFCN